METSPQTRCTAFQGPRRIASGELRHVALLTKTAQPQPRTGPGRPRLGVVAREVTLLPRHWRWLSVQPGGASVALRKLVEDARRAHAGSDRQRDAQEAAYRFMSAMAGDAHGFEEAARALFAVDEKHFEEHIADWPQDVREHAQMLAVGVFKLG